MVRGRNDLEPDTYWHNGHACILSPPCRWDKEGKRCEQPTTKAFFLFGLRLEVPVNNFSVMSGRSHRFLGNNYKGSRLETFFRISSILFTFAFTNTRLAFPSPLKRHFEESKDLFGLRLEVPVNNFSVMSGRSHRFLGNNYKGSRLETFFRISSILFTFAFTNTRLAFPSPLKRHFEESKDMTGLIRHLEHVGFR